MDEELTKKIWRISEDASMDFEARLAEIRTVLFIREKARTNGTKCPGCNETQCNPYSCPEWS